MVQSLLLFLVRLFWHFVNSQLVQANWLLGLHCVSCFGPKDCFQRVCTELNFFDLQLQLCSCRSQTGNATNRMAISYLIATHFLHRWPASRVAIVAGG